MINKATQMSQRPLADPRFALVIQPGEFTEFFEPDEFVFKAGKIRIQTTRVWQDKDARTVDGLGFRADAAGGTAGAKIRIDRGADQGHDCRLKPRDLPQQGAPTT